MCQPCPAASSLPHEFQRVCGPCHGRITAILLTQTYGCHCSIQKRNNLRNALKLDFASFSSFVCRNRRGKPFLSLSLLFKKHVPPSLSLLLCAVQPSALVWLTAACHGSGTSHLPIAPLSLLPAQTPSLLGHGAGPSSALAPHLRVREY